MKKFLNISLLALVALSSLTLGSCKNETEEIFDDDAVARLEKSKEDFINILTAEGGKWQMEYFSNSNEQGYVYLMTFRNDGSVTISGKNKWIGYAYGQSLGSVYYASETSLWDVITDNGPVLSLNSFNKAFHIFADPEDIPSMSDEDTDETGYGHEGDYEFDLMKYANDTLYVTGKKYGIDMIMTRVKGDVDDEVYMNEVTAMADSFFNARIPQVYINLPNGVRWIVKNGASSILKMFREGSDEISTAETHNVIITHDGLSFMSPIVIDGYEIKDFIRQADGSLLCRNDMQTTMTADPLATVFTNQSLSWRLDISKLGGRYADLYNTMADELSAYDKRSLVYAQIAWNNNLQCYAFSFNVKKGTNRYNPTYYMTMERVDDTHVKFNVQAEGDKTGQAYASRVPSMRAFVDAMGASSISLSTTSLLAPVNMQLSEADAPANYSTWYVQ